MECDDRSLLEPDQALDRLLGVALSLEPEEVGLDEADGRVLAAPVIARRVRPAWDLSAMDGYAVRSADLAAAANSLRLVSRAYPGGAVAPRLGVGEACRVTTGARLPPGADRVLIDEVVRLEGAGLVGLGPAEGRTHIRPAGSDFAAGAELVASGSVLGAAELMLAAAAEADPISVIRRPHISIIVTGDEIVAPSACRSDAQTPDSASYPIRALARARGGVFRPTVRCPDDPGEIASQVDAALQASDLVVMIGGASGSERDHARAVAAACGGDILFAGVAMKPGKPAWAAVRSGKIVLGLPGNPVAALVVARLFLVPVLTRLGGRPKATDQAWGLAESLTALPPGGDRTQFLLASRQMGGVRVMARQQTSANVDLAGVDTLVRRDPHAPAVSAGSPVPSAAL